MKEQFYDFPAEKIKFSNNHDPPVNGQAVFFLTGLIEVLSYISELINLATVSDNSVCYQVIHGAVRSQYQGEEPD